MGNSDVTPLGIQVSGVLRKFKAKPNGESWTDEEIEAGLANDYLYETVTFEDGKIIDTWKKGE